MSLVDHARKELEIRGDSPEDIEWYIKVVEAFAEYGHSGGSASVAIPTLNTLLQFKNLCALTNDPKEWNVVAENDLWQSARRSDAFSHDGGITYYLLDEGANSQKPYPIHQSEIKQKD